MLPRTQGLQEQRGFSDQRAWSGLGLERGGLEFEDDAGEVHVVIAVLDLSVPEGEKTGTRKADCATGRGKAEGLPGMGDGRGPAGGGTVSFGEDLVQLHVDI